MARGDGAGRVSKARRALLSAVWSPRPCSCNCAGLRQPRARPRTARAAPSPLALPTTSSLPRAGGHPRRQSLMQSLTRFSLPSLTCTHAPVLPPSRLTLLLPGLPNLPHSSSHLSASSLTLTHTSVIIAHSFSHVLVFPLSCHSLISIMHQSVIYFPTLVMLSAPVLPSSPAPLSIKKI